MNVKSVLGILTGFLLLFFALRSVDFQEIKSLLAGVRYPYLAALGVTLMISFWLRALRWRRMLAGVGQVSTYTCFKVINIGFMANNILPARLGELVRAYALGRREPELTTSFSFATIVLERLLDMLTVVVLMSGAYGFFYFSGQALPAWFMRGGYFVVGVLFLLVGGLALLRYRYEWLRSVLEKVIRTVFRKPSVSERLNRVLGSFLQGLNVIRSRSDAAVIMGYSLLVWISIILLFELAIRSLGITGLPVYASLVCTFVIVVGVMIPGAPGFIGTIQAFSVLALGLFGVSRSTAISVSIVYHISQYIPVTVIGLIYYFSEHLSLKEIKNERRKEVL